MGESDLNEFADAVGLPRPDHVIVRFRLLEHQVHRFNIVAGKTPVPFGVQVPQTELLLFTELDLSDRIGNLPGNELLAAPGAIRD